MISVSNLTKAYGETVAVDGVSFSVERGEVLGFLGPNGAGKTTTMRVLTTFIPPDAGTATLAGFDVRKSPRDVCRKVGYLPENAPLYADMGAVDYLFYVAEMRGIPSVEARGRVRRVVDVCGLGPALTKKIGQLSKGFRQRVGLAQAMIHEPDILILDEPTSGLDPNQIIEIRQLIKELSGQSTIILSTHILPEVSMVCQRVIIINDGHIIAVDTPENLTARLQRSAKLLLTVDGPVGQVEEALTQLPGVLRVELNDESRDATVSFVVESERSHDLRREVSRLIVDRGWGLLELRPADMTLEEIFIRLVTEEHQEVQ
jgi:ABC-2 type transport system ATP-binding protein